MEISNNFKNLVFGDSALSPDIKVADIASGPFEAKLLFYPAGTSIPPHRHSSETLHIVLEGEVEVESGREASGRRTITALRDYLCGGWEYRGIVKRDAYVLLIQEPGTYFIPSDVTSDHPK